MAARSPALSAGLVAASLLAALSARAHEPRPDRNVVVQVDERGVAVLIEMTVRGRQAVLLTAAFDLDKNQSLSPGESAALARAVTSKGLAGLRFSWDGLPLAVRGTAARLVEAEPGMASAVALVTFAAPAHDGGVHELDVAIERNYGAALVQVQALETFRLVGGATAGLVLAPDRRALRDPMALASGGSVSLRVAQVKGR